MKVNPALMHLPITNDAQRSLARKTHVVYGYDPNTEKQQVWVVTPNSVEYDEFGLGDPKLVDFLPHGPWSYTFLNL